MSDGAFSLLIQQLVTHAENAGQRRALVVSGSREWAVEKASIAADIFSQKDLLWVADDGHSPCESLTFSSLRGLLGSECDAVVYDAFSGFDPDAFGRMTGLIRAGGLLLLLTPPLDKWSQFQDPQYRRVTVWPVQTDTMQGHFLSRLVVRVKATDNLIRVEEGRPIPSVPAYSETSPSLDSRIDASKAGFCATTEQKTAVKHLVHVVRGHRRRPLVMTADRGRGKSAALGLAAAQLMLEGVQLIIVTAPSRRAVDTVFASAEAALSLQENVHRSSHGLSVGKSTLMFVAPDALVQDLPVADMVMVDEAAGIPVALLEALLIHYSRIAFTSTVHGYEGTGRGFSVRFKHRLDALAPQWLAFEMQQPIRWAEGDPVEKMVADWLLLDAEPTSVDRLGSDLEAVSYGWYSADKLKADEGRLKQVFGLLVLAHYQTSLLDLRHLLDGANIRVCLALKNGNVVGVVMVAQEGGFDGELADAIFKGKRRVQGHLLPQTLLAQAGLPEAGGLHCLRVIRIAVIPELQRQGIGGALVNAVESRASKDGLDYVGSSFGFTAELWSFWRERTFTAVHLGSRKNKGSGEHSLVMIKPISPSGQAFFKDARGHFCAYFSAMLPEIFSALDAKLLLTLLSEFPSSDDPRKNREGKIIDGFIHHQRSYESSYAVLMFSAVEALSGRDFNPDWEIVVGKLLQQRSWKQVAQDHGLSGRKEVEELLRLRLQPLLSKAK